MNPIARARARLPVSLSDKIKTISTLEELAGFKIGLEFSGVHVSESDMALMANLKIRLAIKRG